MSVSSASIKKLRTCDYRIQDVFFELAKTEDFYVLTGYRGPAAQHVLNDNNLSRYKWPNSPHNKTPSMAVDVIPESQRKAPVTWWDDTGANAEFARRVLEVAKRLGIEELKWGMDLRKRPYRYDHYHYEIKD